MKKQNQKIRRVTQILLTLTLLLSTALYSVANGEQYVISSPAVDKEIPDNGTLITSAIAEGMRSKITDVDIIFKIFHTKDADLDVYLTSPSGTRITLFEDVGGMGDNFLNTRLDDEAQMTFFSGLPLPPEPPYENISIQPFGNLSDFDGENPNGTWVLEVTDDQEFGTGILSEWRLVINAESQIIYVDWFQGGSQQDGQSWETAYRYLQDGLNRAIAGDQVWVTGGANGVSYYPDESLGNPGTNDPNDTFALNNGVAMYGGFKGDESSIAERELTDNESVLSGDIGTWNDSSDNSHHVINTIGCDSNTILDSFTVTAGNAHGTGMKQFGGGMYNDASNLIIRNCNFIDNLADSDGGAIYNDESSPVIENCDFSGGLVARNGGAIHNFYHSSPVIKNCTFTTNVAMDSGGAIYNEWDSCPTIIQSVFKQNLADYGGAIYNAADCNAALINCSLAINWAEVDGGAVFNTQCNPVVINNIFKGNQAGNNGGGMFSKNDSSPVITNCTFSANFADSNGGGLCNEDSSLAVIRNSIFWENKDQGGTAETAQIYGFFPDIANSCIDDDNPGDGDEFGIYNIDTNPMFKNDPNPGPDTLWRTPDDDLGDLRLKYGSSCLESGDNDSVPPDTHDLDNDGNTSEPLPYDIDIHDRLIDWNKNFIATVDMGAYERGVCPGNPDLDGSGLVNFADFAMFAAKWLDEDCDCHGSCCDGTDLNGDEKVNVDDLAILAAHWLGGIESGLVAYYPFDGNNDDIAGGHGGGWNGGSFIADGVKGQAYQFSSEIYFTAGTIPEIDNVNQLTVAIWFKGRNTDWTGGETVVCKGKYTDTPAFQLWFSGNNNPQFFNIQINAVGAEYNSTEPYYVDGLSQWHHYTLVYDGNKAKAYVDGSVIDEINADIGYINTTGHSLYINRHTWWSSGSSSRLEGQVDEFRVYNRALSGLEIQQLYRLE